MGTQELAGRFGKWIDDALSVKLPEGIAAFHFNMYDGPETHEAEIVGCPSYDPDDSDWACDDIFISEAPRFGIPHPEVGQSWEQGLDTVVRMLNAYLATDAAGARRMRESQAVSVGFVDGDLHLLWRRVNQRDPASRVSDQGLGSN